MNITLYTGPGNATERVLWALNYKQIPFHQKDAVNMRAEGKYQEINPYGYVPTLQVDKQYIAESMAIIEFLEECFPIPTLLPGSSIERASIRAVSEIVNSTIHPAQNRSVLNFLRPELNSQSMMSLRADWLHKNLFILKKHLWKKSNYAVGESFSLADIFSAVIYKRALTQGVKGSDWPDYEAYLTFLFAQETIKASAPFSWPYS